MSEEPEPCLGGQCRSPIACDAFGFCRERNFRDGVPSTVEERERRKAEARRRTAEAEA